MSSKSKALWSHSGVELPQAVLEAFENDNLVIFCGAGVSIPDPSNLPSFLGLAKKVAEKVNPAFDLGSINERTQLDVLLGQLDESGGRVHLRVQHLLEESKEPNSLHRHLLGITKGRTTRIVTTNFDEHFERVADEVALSIPTYSAPALPRGNDFHGIVHLHGRVPLREDERLVVTDRDFGQGYITEGWATEFLTRLFDQYTVVFFGYRAQDTVMRYLARALPVVDDGRALYALTPAGSADTWDTLPVTPILYPQPGGSRDHNSLEKFLAGWDAQANSGTTERFDVVAKLHEDGPATSSLSDEQIEWTVCDTELSHMFQSLQPTIEWLKWIESRELLEFLFDSASLDNEEDERWARWVCSTIALDGGRTLVDILARRRGQMSHALWLFAFLELNGSYQAELAGAQLALMLADASAVLEVDRLSVLVATVAKADPITGESLVRRLLTVQNAFKLGWVWHGDGSAQMDIVARWNDYSLRETWAELAPQLSDRDLMIEHLVGVLAAAEAEVSVFSGREQHDGLSMSRSAVAEKELFSSADAVDFVIEILRELLMEEVAGSGPGRALSLLSRKSEIVKKVAVVALGSVALAEDIDASLNALVDGAYIFQYRFKPEVFTTLAALYGRASDTVRQDLCDHIEEFQRSDSETQIGPRRRYDLLEWTSRSWSSDTILNSALARVLQSNPDFGPDPHVHQNSWSDIGAGELRPAPTGRFRGKSHATVANALLSDGTLQDVLDSQETLAEIDDYLKRSRTLPKFLAALADKEIWAAPLWSSVLHMESKRAGQADIAAISTQLMRRPTLSDLASTLQWLLSPAGEQLDKVTSENLGIRLATALDVWRLVRSEVEHDSEPPSAQRAMSTASGIMSAVYLDLLTRLALRRRSKNLTKSERLALSELASSVDNVSDPTLIILARYSRNLHYFDKEWYESSFLPMFDWTSPGAARVWEGLIVALGWSPFLIETFRQRFMSAFRAVKVALPASIDRFIEVSAWLYTRSKTPPDPSWPDSLFIEASEAERGRWISDLGSFFVRFPESYQPEVLTDYWAHRVETSLPAAISAREQAALLGWLRVPGLDFDRAVSLFIRGPLISNQPAERYFHMDFRSLPIAAHPVSSAQLMLHITRGSQWMPQEVRFIAEHVVENVALIDRPLAVQVLEALLGRGFTPARRMIDEVNGE
jgi:hypothetical protein